MITTYGQNGWFQIQIDGVHDDEHLLVFVQQAGRFAEGGLTVVLHPAVFTQERRRQPQR